MDIFALFVVYGAWSWLVLGFVLLALELLLPGGVFIWLGAAGIVTGLIEFIYPVTWPIQIMIFGILGIVAIVLWLRLVRNRGNASDRPLLNRRAERFIGHETVLDEPITDGFGRVPLGDTVWRVSGPDLSAGRRVRIVGHDGAVLKVEAV